MIRALFNILFSILALVLIVFGALLITAHYFSTHDNALAALINFVTENAATTTVVVLGMVSMVGGMFLFLFSSLGPRESPNFQFNTDIGGVGISLAALENFIAKAAKDLPMVESAKPTVLTSSDGKRLRLMVQTNVIATGSVKNVSEAVQEAVITAIRDGLGLTEVETVDVEISKISMPKGGLPKPQAALPAGDSTPGTPLLEKPKTTEAASESWRGSDASGDGDADEAHHPVS